MTTVTRSCAGARAVFWALLALVAATTSSAARDDAPAPLPWRVGGGLGFTVDAASFPDTAGGDYVLEVYLRLPPATLANLSRTDRGEGRIRIETRLRNRFGALHHEAKQEFGVAPSDTGTYGKVVVLRFPVKPGLYGLEVRLQDPGSRKRGLAYIGRNVAQSASVEGELTVPAMEGRVRLSDLEFLWGDASPRLTYFRRAGAEAGFLPNPERLYGLLAPELKVQFVGHDPEGAPSGWRWRSTLVDAAGKVVAQRETTAAAGPWLVQNVGMDVSTMPAGTYELEVRAWREGDSKAFVRRGRLSVAWRQGSWSRNPRDLEDEMHFLLDRQEDEETFARLSPGEQERYIDEFWRLRDPTPGTAWNETEAEFRGRIDYANRTWTRSGIGKGMFTDMGRVFIRHGEPSEILRQVIPAGDQTLAQLLQEMEVSEDRPTGDVRSRAPGGDMRPFEVWIYEGERGPSITATPDRAAAQRSRKRILFLFVDDRGFGDYRLRYSTE